MMNYCLHTIEEKMKNRLIGKMCLISLILIILFAINVNAMCNFQSIQFYGACPYDGDIYVYDSQNNLIVKQLYGENTGCYEGNYLMQIPGGPEEECILNSNEKISFKINVQEVATYEWNMDSQRVALDLVNGGVVSSGAKVGLLNNNMMIILAILIALIIVVEFARKVHRRR